MCRVFFPDLRRTSPVYCCLRIHTLPVVLNLNSGTNIFKFCETRAELFFVVLKAQRDEGDGRILLGDNTFGEAVTLRLIRLQCGVRI